MADERIQRRLAAILAVDVVGYSRLMREDEERTVHNVREKLETIGEMIGGYGGRIFASAGDSVLAEFASPVQALRCAIEIQREAANPSESRSTLNQIVFRIGINLGDVIAEEDNLYGDGVNVAARLESIANPATVYISESVYQQAHHQVKALYEDLGPIRLHNIDEPVRVYRIRPLGGVEAARTAYPLRRLAQKRSLAIVVLSVLVGAAGIGLAIWRGAWWPAAKQPDKEQTFPELALPKRHFRIENPAQLEPADAYTIYDRIHDDMAAAYGRSGNEIAERYQSWRRYNVTPYRSAQHGQRFVNNYGNGEAEAYARFDEAGPLPQGSVLAKDSFEVRENGDVMSGPLAIMEKMPEGFDPDGGNWRYTMILPNGSVFGATGGAHNERVGFCRECHKEAADTDYLFFLPDEYRVEIFGTIQKEN